MSDYDDELEHVLAEVTRPGPLDGDDDGLDVQPLCARCLRDVPNAPSDICQFCQTVEEAHR